MNGSTFRTAGELVGYQRRGAQSALVLRCKETQTQHPKFGQISYTAWVVVEPGGDENPSHIYPPRIDEPVNPPRPWVWEDFAHTIAE